MKRFHPRNEEKFLRKIIREGVLKVAIKRKMAEDPRPDNPTIGDTQMGW